MWMLKKYFVNLYLVLAARIAADNDGGGEGRCVVLQVNVLC